MEIEREKMTRTRGSLKKTKCWDFPAGSCEKNKTLRKCYVAEDVGRFWDVMGFAGAEHSGTWPHHGPSPAGVVLIFN